MLMSRLLLLVLGACLLGGCSPFVYLNAFSPEEEAREEIDIAYGTLPRQRLDVYVPATPPGGPAPVVVFFYGGAWDSGKKANYRFVGRTMAARGFVVVIPDYRVYPEVVFPGFIEDAAAAVAWTFDGIPRYGGDTSRVFLMGHSAGAHIAAMVALNGGYLEVEGHSPDQLAGWIGLSGPYDFLPLKSRRLKEIFGDPAPRTTQPVEFVTPVAPPALLVTGDADTRVIPRNTHRLEARLLEAGVPVRKIVYPDIGHGRTVAAFSGLGDDLPVVDDVESFVGDIVVREPMQFEARRQTIYGEAR
ncbi:MAG: alpha/beta hydrolase [Betaproteobacteria bacterium]|nr:MAG: alpha/beta hydrolase [Betaproteobacteria bacterium]